MTNEERSNPSLGQAIHFLLKKSTLLRKGACHVYLNAALDADALSEVIRLREEVIPVIAHFKLLLKIKHAEKHYGL